MLIVCTGNRARSPLALAMLERALETQPVELASAGVLDLTGTAALPEAVEAGRGHGLDLSNHASTFLGLVDLSGFDAIVGFERDHLASAVVEFGAGPDKTFTLPELVRLLESTVPETGDPVAVARGRIAAAAERRASDPQFIPGEDVTDPIGQDPTFFEDTAERIATLCERLVELLFPAA